MRELARQAPTDPKAKKARNAILQMLQNNNTTIEAVSVWPDEVRRSPEYGYADNWHFVSIPRNAVKYDPATQCKTSATAPAGDCAIGGLAHFKNVFMNSPNAAARFDALRFIVHFLGDLHQPLHASEDWDFIHNGQPGDRGGNYRLVCFLAVSQNACTEVYHGERSNRNLHATWDKYIILAMHPDEHAYIDQLDNRIKAMSAGERAGHMSGTTIDWAEGTHALAVAESYNVPKVKTLTTPHSNVYNEYFFVSSSYEMANAKRIDDQLIKAGLRLAAYLKQLV